MMRLHYCQSDSAEPGAYGGAQVAQQQGPQLLQGTKGQRVVAHAYGLRSTQFDEVVI